MLSWDMAMAMAMVLRRVRPPHLYQRRNTKPAVCLISHVGRGRFFESRVTGGASGRNTSSLKSWRDGPLSEQRSIFEKGAFDFEMVDSPHILRYRRNRNGRYAHWMPSTRHARMSYCRNRSLFRFTRIRHACYVESRHPVRVSTISSPAGRIYTCI